MMKKLIQGAFGIAMITLTAGTAVSSVPSDAPVKIAIVKADDLQRPSENWDRFIEVSNELQVKVSIGIICDSLQEDSDGYFDWLRARQSSGSVEFWNHGWDHKRWGPEGEWISEFQGSGYAYQKKHLDDSQAIMKEVLGVTTVAFATPWNDFDEDTGRVVNEREDVRLFIGHHRRNLDQTKLLVRMRLRAELDGTGKPNFEKFVDLYEELQDKDAVVALQFHPNVFEDHHFAEYKKIVIFMQEKGWTFMMPRECLEAIGET
jgi:peptidoglycan/xylan/chitin deacetylase (PgdA/CDA1 family)